MAVMANLTAGYIYSALFFSLFSFSIGVYWLTGRKNKNKKQKTNKQTKNILVSYFDGRVLNFFPLNVVGHCVILQTSHGKVQGSPAV